MARPRQRLNESSLAAAHVFAPTENDWSRIESAYNQRLSEHDRQQIAEIVGRYYVWAQHEAAAPSLKGAQRLLQQLKKAAGEFSSALQAIEGGGGDIYDDAQRQQARVVERLVEKHRPHDYLPWGELSYELVDFVAACRRAETELSDRERPQFREGESWEKLVKDLHDWAKDNGHPHRVRKDNDKSSSASPFVRLIFALQEGFPPQLRRHMHSLAALSTAISEHRNANREK